MEAHPYTLYSRREYWLVAVAAGVGFGCWWSSSERTAQLLANTGGLALAVSLVAIPLAASLAYVTSRCEIPLKRLWHACMLILLFAPLHIQLASWEAGFGRGGWYSALIARHLSHPPLEGFRGAVWVHAMAAVPWLYWIFHLGLTTLPRTFEEAASLDASPWRVYCKITLPLTLPTILAAAFFVLIVVSTEITVTDRYQFRSYAEELYYEYALNTELAALPLGMAPILGSLVAAIVSGLLLCKLVWPALVHQAAGRTADRHRPTNWAAFGFVAAVVAGLLLIPLANLVYQAGIEVRANDTGRIRVWSLSKLVKIVATTPVRYQTELAWTAILSQLSVLSAVAGATLLSWWARKARWRQMTNAMLAITCFVIPGPFLGLAIIFLLNRPSYLGWLYEETLLAPWLALTVRCFPFAYLILWYGMNAIPKSVLESAEADGAGAAASLWYIALPLLRPSLVCAVLVCLAVSLGDVSASALLIPPGVTTVATEIFRLIHFGADDRLAGLCLASMIVISVIALLATATARRLGNPVRDIAA